MPATISRLGSALTIYSLMTGAHAVSAEAKSIDENEYQIASEREQALSVWGPNARLLSELREIVESSSPEDKPRELAVREAENLIRALPLDILGPEITVEDDSDIAIEWLPSRTRMLSVSINGSGRLAYAWINGTESGHAVARFISGTVPPVLLGLIREVSGANAGFRTV